MCLIAALECLSSWVTESLELYTAHSLKNEALAGLRRSSDSELFYWRFSSSSYHNTFDRIRFFVVICRVNQLLQYLPACNWPYLGYRVPQLYSLLELIPQYSYPDVLIHFKLAVRDSGVAVGWSLNLKR